MPRTKEQEREYKRKYRAAKQAGQPTSGSAALKIVTENALEYGTVFEAVRAECAELPLAKRRPVDVAMALRLAEVMDDETATPQKPAAALRLSALMADLRGEVDGGTSKLATLRALRTPR